MKQNRLNEFMCARESEKIATEHGIDVHARLSCIKYCDGDFVGDPNIVAKIKDNAELCEIMGPLSRAEVPLAGYVNGVFLGRRIDRLYVNESTKTIVVLDYKTDIDKKMYYEKYRAQLTEYRDLLKQIYPSFKILCKILWIHDFTLENVI